MLIVFITIVMLAFGSRWLTTSSRSRISCIDDGWSISRDGFTVDNQYLPDYKIGKTKKGDSITITKDIRVSASNYTIMFKSQMETVEVFFDGVSIYSYGEDFYDAGEFIPKDYHLISLFYTGNHTISIKFVMGEDNSVKSLPSFFYGNKHDLLRAFFSYHRTSFFVGGFLIIYSCLLFSLWLYLYLIGKMDVQVIIGSIFSMMMGCYIYAHNDIFCMVGSNAMLFSMLEYSSFYFIPLAFSVLLYSIHKDIANIAQKGIIFVNIVFPILFFALHIMGIAYIDKFIYIAGIIATIEIIILLPPLIAGVVKQQQAKDEIEYDLQNDAEFYLIVGFIIFVVFVLIELGTESSFGTRADYTKPNAFSTVNFLELGMLFFMICHFIYYFVSSIEHMSASRVREQLEGLAFSDELTGLMNQARYTQYTATLTDKYAVISIDLDRLKYVNDTLGHLEGDRMIKAFSNILKEAFDKANVVARTGGDEFIVIFEEPVSEICDNCLDRMAIKMGQFNNVEHKFKLSASFGLAYSDEVDSGKYKDVFYLADSRMYEMKEAHHG